MRKRAFVAVLSAVVAGGALCAPAAAQDFDNMRLSLELTPIINFGKTEELRTLIERTPGFASLTHPFFEMPYVDGLLCDAAMAKQARVEIVELLLDLGADATARCAPTLGDASPRPLDQAFGGYNLTLPAMQASDSIMGPPLWPTERVDGEVYFEIAAILADEMPDVDANALMYRYSYHSPRLVRWAMARGADPDAVMDDGRSSRQQAAKYIEMTEAMIAQLNGGAGKPQGDMP